MPDPGFLVDALRLEARLAAIETKLSDTGLRDRVASMEKEVKEASGSTTRLDERVRHLATGKDLNDVLQRITKLETRVAELPTKGFIVSVVLSGAALIAAVMSLGRFRSMFNF